MNDTKEHILKVSLGLFLRKSFKEVTMKELVEKTGMSKGAFYHYFESKEQLFLEVANNILSMANIDYSKFGNDSLYHFYNEYIDYLATATDTVMKSIAGAGDDLGFNYFLLIFEAVKLFPSIKKNMIESQQAELDAWKRIVSIARKNGEICSPMSDEQISNMFIFSNDGVGMRFIMSGINDYNFNTLGDLWKSFYEEIKA